MREERERAIYIFIFIYSFMYVFMLFVCMGLMGVVWCGGLGGRGTDAHGHMMLPADEAAYW